MSRRCEHQRFDGRQCSNWAIQTTNPPRCLPHLRGVDRREYFAMLDKKASDPEMVLREELRIIKRFKHSMERAQLVVEIMRMLTDLENKKKRDTKPEDLGRELTPAEKVAALRKKDV